MSVHECTCVYMSARCSTVGWDSCTNYMLPEVISYFNLGTTGDRV